ncbi:MAG: hypothetical protein QXE96_05415 [Candidatus Caldarchaeum sp.]
MFSKQPVSAGRFVKGYVSGLVTRVVSDGVVYFFTLSTLEGEDVVFRMRQPPEWLYTGTPVEGLLVKADDVYQIQDLSQAAELAQPRIVEVDRCDVAYVGTGTAKKPVVTGSAGRLVISAPAITVGVARKAEKIGYTKCVLHVADLATGARIVAVQTSQEYRRDASMKKVITMLSHGD